MDSVTVQDSGSFYEGHNVVFMTRPLGYSHLFNLMGPRSRNLVPKCAELLDRGLDISCRDRATGRDAFHTAQANRQRQLQRLLGKYMKHETT